ncbi:HK97-gp10 family putative phage morphogenesis protein [Ensifer aridi]|uniref:HK97-gp10 family putative phage morphogenesis protein n=1 Tax=Ensifer aridi TaxID=1708715 RepID=UPI000A0F669C|nr:HK97-gp10 family putative phage morphogenesis protein [Ensifer aridi]
MKVTSKILGREKLMRLLRDVVPEAEKELAKEQLDAAKSLAGKIRNRAPGSGRYRGSIEGDKLSNRTKERAIGRGLKSETKDPNATGVFADWRWRFIEFGTRQHVIEPKTGEYLVIRGADGRVTYTKQVNHPGATKHPHIFPTYRQERPKIRRKMAAAVRKAIKKVKSK